MRVLTSRVFESVRRKFILAGKRSGNERAFWFDLAYFVCGMKLEKAV